MKIVNLTPHEITIYESADNSAGAISVLSSGIARCEEQRTYHKPLTAGGYDYPISSVSYSNIRGLPEPERNTIYIVSFFVLQALDGTRPDVYSPGVSIRNASRRVVGCVGLTQL